MVSHYPSRGILVVLLLLDPTSTLTLGHAVCGRANCSDSGCRDERRFARTLHPRRCRGRCYPHVSVCYRASTVVDFHPTCYSCGTIHVMARHPNTHKECIVYRLSSMPAARRWVWMLVVICAGVGANSPFLPAF